MHISLIPHGLRKCSTFPCNQTLEKTNRELCQSPHSTWPQMNIKLPVSSSSHYSSKFFQFPAIYLLETSVSVQWDVHCVSNPKGIFKVADTDAWACLHRWIKTFSWIQGKQTIFSLCSQTLLKLCYGLVSLSRAPSCCQTWSTWKLQKLQVQTRKTMRRELQSSPSNIHVWHDKYKNNETGLGF